MKQYKRNDSSSSIVREPAVAYASLGSNLNSIVSIDKDDSISYLEIIHRGVSYSVLTDFMKLSSLHIDVLADILHITSRTLRRQTDKKLLSIPISEKLVELIRLYKWGHEVFGDTQIFNEWMHRRIRSLGYRVPIEIIDTSIGVEIVYNELSRLTYGVYS